jgi:hypothetical protein
MAWGPLWGRLSAGSCFHGAASWSQRPAAGRIARPTNANTHLSARTHWTMY